VTVSVSGLSWTPNGPDHSRYLPKDSGRRSIVAAVTVDGVICAAARMVVAYSSTLHAPPEGRLNE
jgi:purine-cytosine permease-like protein